MTDDTKKTDEAIVDPAVEKEMEGVPEHLREDGVDDEEAQAGDEDDLSEALEALRNDLAEAKQEVLYARADTQNVRRRMEKDVADARTYAATGFARDILSVADNLARAVDSIPEAFAKTRSSRGSSPASKPLSVSSTRYSASTGSRASPPWDCRSIPTFIRQ